MSTLESVPVTIRTVMNSLLQPPPGVSPGFQSTSMIGLGDAGGLKVPAGMTPAVSITHS